MNPFPEDIFTEPEDVDPDTLANLGPLRRLAGTWEGRKGIDLNPKAEGPERREYLERIDMQPIDPQANGPQLFYGLRYHVHILAPERRHRPFTIRSAIGCGSRPRGWCCNRSPFRAARWRLRPGRRAPMPQAWSSAPNAARPSMASVPPAFLEYAFRTDAYASRSPSTPTGAGAMCPTPCSWCGGVTSHSAHRDRNTLVKVAEPTPNPLFQIISKRDKS